MATLGILKLPETTAVVNNDLFLVQQNNVTKQTTLGNLKFGYDNVTFGSTISANSDSLNYLNTTLVSLSSSVFGSTANLQNFVYNILNKSFLNLSLLLYPIGSVKYTSNFINPGSLIPNTKWNLISEGLYLAGVGTTTDNGSLYVNGDKNGSIQTFTVGADTSLGEYQQLIIAAQLPSHTHKLTIRLNFTTGGGDNSYATGTQVAPAMELKTATSYTTTNGAGGGLYHNNMTPLYGVYAWQRIS